MRTFKEPFETTDEWDRAFDEYWKTYYPDQPVLEAEELTDESWQDLLLFNPEAERTQQHARFVIAQYILYRDMGLSITDYAASCAAAGRVLNPQESAHVQRRLAAHKIMLNGLALFMRRGRTDEEVYGFLDGMDERFRADIDFQIACSEMCSKYGAVYRMD